MVADSGHSVRKLKVREVVPRTEFPNFRDAGRTVDRPLLSVIGSLQKKYGEAFASEDGLRRLIAEDTGHMPGVDTIATALERLSAQGIVQQIWLKPGGVLPDGNVSTHGTRLVHLPVGRRNRRALKSTARREGTTRRVQRRLLTDLDEARGKLVKAKGMPDVNEERARQIEEKRRADLERLKQLEANWEREDLRGKPPPN